MQSAARGGRPSSPPFSRDCKLAALAYISAKQTDLSFATFFYFGGTEPTFWATLHIYLDIWEKPQAPRAVFVQGGTKLEVPPLLGLETVSFLVSVSLPFANFWLRLRTL